MTATFRCRNLYHESVRILLSKEDFRFIEISTVIERVKEQTVSSVDFGNGAGSFAHHDGDVRVVLFHCGVSADEE